jgi:hypothetical protein
MYMLKKPWRHKDHEEIYYKQAELKN